MAEADAGSATGNSGGGAEASLKDKGNEFFKAGNYLKAAALYTQAIKLDPSNPALYRYIPLSLSFLFLLGMVVKINQNVSSYGGLDYFIDSDNWDSGELSIIDLPKTYQQD